VGLPLTGVVLLKRAGRRSTDDYDLLAPMSDRVLDAG
jgi:hypothetical protein